MRCSLASSRLAQPRWRPSTCRLPTGYRIRARKRTGFCERRGSGFYGGAGLVGASRIYNNMDWASDVVAGAAIGTIIGLRVVKYTHSHPDNRIDTKLIKGHTRSQIQINPVLYSIQF